MGELADTYMDELDGGDVNAPRRARSQHPTGWEPGAEFNGRRLEVTTQPMVDEAKWSEVMSDRGLDIKEWRLDGPIQFRTWDAAIGGGEVREMRYFKATFLPKSDTLLDDEDVAALIHEIGAHIVRPPAVTDGPDCMVVCISDFQVGKADGDGTKGTVDRILTAITDVAHHIEQVRPKSLLIASLGDLVESCDGHYAMQAFSVELDRRDQIKLLRRLLTKAVTTWAPLVPTTVVAAAAGNHGENRKDGKSFTTFGDNDDLAVWEQVQEVIESNPEYAERIGWVIPTGDELTCTVEAGGAVVGLAHGHQARSGVTPQKKLWEWWKGQMSGRQPIGDADLLLTGHFHHLSVSTPTAGRTHIQVPAMDGGSTWWRHSTGQESAPGMVTFTIDGGEWNRLVIL